MHLSKSVRPLQALSKLLCLWVVTLVVEGIITRKYQTKIRGKCPPLEFDVIVCSTVSVLMDFATSKYQTRKLKKLTRFGTIRCLTWVGSSLSEPSNVKLARDKHSSLFIRSVSDEEKPFNNIAARPPSLLTSLPSRRTIPKLCTPSNWRRGFTG
jgi:hypothetical protein